MENIENLPKTRREIALFDIENPRALGALVPDEMRVQMRLMAESDQGHLLGSVEYALRRELIRNNKEPTALDNRLRMQFWLEFDRTMLAPNFRQMDLTMVTGRLITKEHFYKQYIKDHFKLAWLLCPPLTYAMRIEETICYAIDRIFDALHGHMINPQTQAIDVKVLDKVLQVVEKLERIRVSTKRGENVKREVPSEAQKATQFKPKEEVPAPVEPAVDLEKERAELAQLAAEEPHE